MKMRHKVSLVRLIFFVVVCAELGGFFWGISQIRKVDFRVFGLSQDWTAGLFALVCLIWMLGFGYWAGGKMVRWWIRVEKENKDGSFPSRE